MESISIYRAIQIDSRRFRHQVSICRPGPYLRHFETTLLYSTLCIYQGHPNHDLLLTDDYIENNFRLSTVLFFLYVF